MLDCFAGSGSTLVAAEQLGRRWIGIDAGDLAFKTAKRRLEAECHGLFGGAVDAVVVERSR